MLVLARQTAGHERQRLEIPEVRRQIARASTLSLLDQPPSLRNSRFMNRPPVVRGRERGSPARAREALRRAGHSERSAKIGCIAFDFGRSGDAAFAAGAAGILGTFAGILIGARKTDTWAPVTCPANGSRHRTLGEARLSEVVRPTRGYLVAVPVGSRAPYLLGSRAPYLLGSRAPYLIV